MKPIIILALSVFFSISLIAQKNTTNKKSNISKSTIDKKQFLGRYNGEKDGEGHYIAVEIINNHLELSYKSGGTMTFGYKEKSIQEVIKNEEYVLTTIDIDKNGAYSFAFRKNKIKGNYNIIVKSLDDSNIEPLTLQFEGK